MRVFTLMSALILILSLFTACSSSEKFDTSTAEGAFKLAEKYEKDERFEEAITQYNEVKNKFPYNSLATEAELKVADIQYTRKNYIESQVAYEVFKELHPRHPRSDYVTHKLGLSLFHQLPSTIDRDLTLAERAILYFQEVIRSYPQSEHVPDAQKHLAEAREMLSDKVFYIGDFYFVRELYGSALERYESLVTKFPDSKNEPMALANATRSAMRISDREKAVALYQSLKSEHPTSEAFKDLEGELGEDLGK